MRTLFKNIKQLIQVRDEHIAMIAGADMKQLPIIENAYMLIEDDRIVDYGPMDEVPRIDVDEEIDASGRVVMPSWCDSHTHIVYAGSRVGEFVDRINGLSYEEIANRGGGIVNSAKRLQQTTEDDLYEQSAVRLLEVMAMGTGAIEIKSGYGLTLDAELKMLRVIRRLRDDFDLPIKATFLGAHALPMEYKQDKNGYMRLVIDEMLPALAAEGLADYVDIFCEKGYFTVSDTEQLLEAAAKYGLKPKIHVNQFNAIGGVQTGVKYGALSVDHLEEMRTEDIDVLHGSKTMPVALPSCSYFLSIPYTPARQMIDAGLSLALATDYNPGSTPSGNMNFVVATACIKMRMTPAEAINAATINGAYAMELSEEAGSITRGKKANLFMTKPIERYEQIPYSFGSDVVDSVYINGKKI